MLFEFFGYLLVAREGMCDMWLVSLWCYIYREHYYLAGMLLKFGLYALNSDSLFLLGYWITVGAEADDDRIELLLSEVKGKDVTELIAAGREKLASVPSGGGAVAVAAAPAGAGAAAPAAEAKEEKKVEEKEESDDVSFCIALDCLLV